MTTHIRPTVVFIPGLLSDAALWADQVLALSATHDVQVADITGADTMAELARDVLSDAPDQFALAGLSMGGYVAQEIVRQAPHRVTHLALLDTNARADLADQSARRKALIADAGAGRFDAITRAMLANLVTPQHLADPAICEVLVGMAERVGAKAFARQQTAILNRVDGRADLPRIDCPTLVLCGQDDVLTPPDAHLEMADAIGANATLVGVPDCGHMSPLEQPGAVTQALLTWLEAGRWH